MGKKGEIEKVTDGDKNLHGMHELEAEKGIGNNTED